MLTAVAAFIVSPFDDIIALWVAQKVGLDMPSWIFLLLAILFGWLVMPRILAFAGK